MKLASIKEPIDPDLFVKKFSTKYQKWGNPIITNELIETWKQNCLVFNNVIKNKDKGLKYIISAPTGSAKTENTITYSAMLPKDVKVLISTNLIDEANRLSNDINNEANDDRACAYHSRNNIKLDEALKHQIVITTHAFYKNNISNTRKWRKILKNRDLVIIDEAINTFHESSVTINEVRIAFNLFETLHQQILKNKDKFQSLGHILDDEIEDYVEDNLFIFEKEFSSLNDELGNIIEILTDPPTGISLYRSNKLIDVSEHVGGVPCMLQMFVLPKFTSFIKLLKNNKIKYNKLLTGIDDESNDKQIKENVISTLEKLNHISERQVYITSNEGEYSLNRVVDFLPKQSVVCMDATADVNEVYKLRQQYHNDIILVPRIENVRDYSTVNLYTLPYNTSKKHFTKDVLQEILKQFQFGNQTLFVVNKRNKESLQGILKDSYEDKKTDVANWGALTGLNDWQEYDSCMMIGLNHKTTQFVQNRNLANTNESTAFGFNQENINQNIKISDLVSEIVQAMNRIRIRKISTNDGKCENANIYLFLPLLNYKPYISLIKEHMTNINVRNWNITLTGDQKLSGFDQLIGYLESNMKKGEKIKLTTPRDALGIKAETYRSIIGKKKEKQEEFLKKLKRVGYDILEIDELGSKKRKKKNPTKYFVKL